MGWKIMLQEAVTENKEITSEFLTGSAITCFFLCEEGMKKSSKCADDINKSKEES